MGWYIYEQVDRTCRQSYIDDTVEISGHDVASVLMWKGTDGLEELVNTFNTQEENYRVNSEEVLLG
jgi:hypothetical protein